MTIIKQLIDKRADIARAIDRLTPIRDRVGEDAVDALMEFCAEIIGTDEYSDTDVAVEVAGLLSPGDEDKYTVQLDVPSDIVHIIRWNPVDEEWEDITDEV
jgi:hypothetical protein